MHLLIYCSRRFFYVYFIGRLKTGLRTAVIRYNSTESNSINSQARDTIALQPTMFCTAMYLLHVSGNIKRYDCCLGLKFKARLFSRFALSLRISQRLPSSCFGLFCWCCCYVTSAS